MWVPESLALRVREEGSWWPEREGAAAGRQAASFYASRQRELEAWELCRLTALFVKWQREQDRVDLSSLSDREPRGGPGAAASLLPQCCFIHYLVWVKQRWKSEELGGESLLHNREDLSSNPQHPPKK